MGQDKGKGIANTDRSHGCRADEKNTKSMSSASEQ
mgnify:CR=1 FL=1